MKEHSWPERAMNALPFPRHWQVLGPYGPTFALPESSPEVLCAAALTHPVGAAPLAARDLRGQRILLIVDDHSRPTPIRQFFPAVRTALLQAGADDHHIEILFALGTHRPMTPEEACAKIGPDNAARHRWHNHDARDPERLVRVGTTTRGTPVIFNRLLREFDLLVPLGLIEPHVLAGYSGGCKMLLPGCAGTLTIGRNHLLGSEAARWNYVGAPPAETPMRLDLEEGAALLGKEIFLVNAVQRATGEIVNFFCGDPRDAFRAGVAYVRRHTEAVLPEQADVVITGSSPFDADLRQGVKCLGNTLHEAKPGGLVLGLLGCRNGLGDLPLPRRTLPYTVLRFLLRLLGCRAVEQLRNLAEGEVAVEERFLTRFGLRMLRRNHLWFASDSLPPDIGRRLGVLRQFASADEMVAAAVRKVGPKATVALFPQGGATYVPDEALSLWCGLEGRAPRGEPLRVGWATPTTGS